MSGQDVRREYRDIDLRTGVRLRYVERGDPTAPAIILLHGITDTSFSYSMALPELARNYHVIVPDQRGHGESDKPEDGYQMADFAADVVALMDALELSKAAVVGHSMGSFIAQRVALDAPERLTSLVLVASAEACRNEGVLELRREMETLPDPVPEAFARQFQESTVYAPLPEGFMDRVVAECRKAPARVWRAALTGLIDAEMTARLGEIHTPTLVIWGEKDAIFSRAEQDGLMARLPAATMKVYEETGHAPHWERPERVVRDIEAWVARAR